MRISLSCLALIAGLALMPLDAQAQSCLHGPGETLAERQRRTDALIAVRLVNEMERGAKGSARPSPGYLPLAELGNLIAPHRSDGGPLGKVARALQLTSRELLPGWVVEFVFAPDGYAIHLRDSRDVCGLTLVSDHTGIILTAYPVDTSVTRQVDTN